jgi:competence protein ComEC
MKAGAGLSLGLKLSAKWLVVPLVALAALVSFTAATLPDDRLHVSFLDVGEGDAILIQKGNTQVLVDGGPSPQAVTVELSGHMPFWDRTIDLLVLTHPHQDHLGGLVEVLKRYRVGNVIYPGMDYESPLFDEFLRCIEEKNIRSVNAVAGQQINMAGGVEIMVLNPPESPLAGTQSDVDNESVVLFVRYRNVSFLLTGDIMRETELELLRGRADVAGTVLKVAHHGSDTSSTAGFLAVTGPQIAVISCGADNKFGHPDGEVLERLGEKAGEENVLRTDINGTIDFTTDGERLWVEKER